MDNMQRAENILLDVPLGKTWKKVLHRRIFVDLDDAERRGREEERWQPIETAPKHCFVLVARKFDGWRMSSGRYCHYSGEWKVCGAIWTPTHWMPLPEPPAARGQS